jgi:hypothetical protein
MRVVYQQISWNPPLPDGAFEQAAPAGVPEEQVTCE